MKLTFLGTGAADWPTKPAENAFHRYLSSLLIDDTLLVDAGPCVPDAAKKYADLARVENILVTHSHSDHFSAKTLEWLAEGGKKTVWLTAPAAKLVPQSENLTVCEVIPFVPFPCGEYRVTAVAGNHSTGIPEEQPVHYIIERDGKTVYYGLDGAWMINRSFHELQKHTFDAMVFDCTAGDRPGEWRLFEHNTIPMLRYMLDTMRAAYPQMFGENCRLIASHMARTLHGSHEELMDRLAEFGMEAAYDGWTLTV